MSDQAPHPMDLHVGARIRTRRRMLGQSQEALADHLGLTFQQVQKYERGVNRISASKLWEVARAQQSPVSYYFENFDGSDQAAAPIDTAFTEFSRAYGSEDVAVAFVALPPYARRQVVSLLGSMRDLLCEPVEPTDSAVDHGAVAAFN